MPCWASHVALVSLLSLAWRRGRRPPAGELVARSRSCWCPLSTVALPLLTVGAFQGAGSGGRVAKTKAGTAGACCCCCVALPLAGPC